MADPFDFTEDTVVQYESYGAVVKQLGSMRYSNRDSFPNGVTVDRPENFKPFYGFFRNLVHHVHCRIKTQNLIPFGNGITVIIKLLSVDKEVNGDYDNEIYFFFSEPDEWQSWTPRHDLILPKDATYMPLFEVQNPLALPIEVEWAVEYEDITAMTGSRTAITLDVLRQSYPGFHL